MKKSKSEILRLCSSLFTFIILFIGASFAYYSYTARGTEDAIGVKSFDFGLHLDVVPLYAGFTIIPTNDADIMKAFNNKCLDSYGIGACLAFEITVTNTADPQDVMGVMEMQIEGLTNLNYVVLDEDNNIYHDISSISQNSSYSLGKSFTLAKDEVKKLYLVYWVSNKEYPQDLDDAGGTFSSSIAVSSVAGDVVKANITGEY